MAEPKRGPKGQSRVTGAVLVDSGPLLALFNGADKWHAKVLAWLRSNEGAQLVTTWPVLTEVCALLSRRVGNPAALDFLRWAHRGGVDVDEPIASTLESVLAISERYADLPLDLADASIAEAAARLRTRQVLTLDSDFDIYRDKAGKALTNVLHLRD